MKLDLSYTDHSHIIGRGGLTIKQVMENTGCHIHFPDSNRTSLLEKSNQVSIAGNCGAVERARTRVRVSCIIIVCKFAVIKSMTLGHINFIVLSKREGIIKM